MFEDRHIQLMTYNLETLLAEKLETMISRGTANTRMRDFYDVFLLAKQGDFNLSTLQSAIVNTSKKRSSEPQLMNYSQIMKDVASSTIMETAWDGFKRQSYFVDDLPWGDVLKESIALIDRIFQDI